MNRSAVAFLCLVALGVLSLGGCYLWSSSDEYYGLGLEADQRRVLFVIDVSGSMEDKAEGKTPKGRLSTRATDEAISRGSKAAGGFLSGRAGGLVRKKGEERAREQTTKLGAAKRELMPMIQGLEEDVQFNILVFGRDSEDWQPDLVRATESNRRKGRLHVDGLSADGNTPARGALERAFEEELDVIFFVSDGKPTDAKPKEILERVDELNSGRGVAIHTIGLGEDMDEVFMDRLAEQNGGSFVYFE